VLQKEGLFAHYLSIFIVLGFKLNVPSSFGHFFESLLCFYFEHIKDFMSKIPSIGFILCKLKYYL